MRKASRLLLIALLLIGCGGGGGGGSDGTSPAYTVTYNGNGNTGGSVPVDATKYVQGQTVTGLGNTGNLLKTYYAFSGWNTQANGSGATYTQGQTFAMGTSNVTLYAMWTSSPTYTITYDGNGNTGGSVPIDTTIYVQGQTATGLGNTGFLVKNNYSFSGWNTQADGSGTTYAEGQSFTMGATSAVLYAKWTTIATPPEITIVPQDIDLTVTDNVPKIFYIFNTGGGVLDYLVADDGPLGGYLDIQLASGSVPSGLGFYVIVSGKPVLFSEPMFPMEEIMTIALSVYTPDASNYIHSHVSVHVISNEIEFESSSCTPLGSDSGVSQYQITYSGTATGGVNDYLSFSNDTVFQGVSSSTLTCEGWSVIDNSACTRQFRSQPLMTHWSRKVTFSIPSEIGIGIPPVATFTGESYHGVPFGTPITHKTGPTIFCGPF